MIECLGLIGLSDFVLSALVRNVGISTHEHT